MCNFSRCSLLLLLLLLLVVVVVVVVVVVIVFLFIVKFFLTKHLTSEIKESIYE
jgi:hypothetical protein